MFEKKLNPGTLGKVSKTTLRQFKNRSRMTAGQYAVALQEYNTAIDRRRDTVKTALKDQKTVFINYLMEEQFISDVIPLLPKDKRPKIRLAQLGGYVEHWIKNKKGHFEIRLQSRIADVSKVFKFNHINQFRNWFKKLIDEQEVNSAGNVIDNDKYDLFADVIISSIKLISGGCNKHNSKSIGLKSSFYNYKLFNPTSINNNCFLACLNHIKSLGTSRYIYSDIRKRFNLENNKEITIETGYKIINELGYDVKIIDYDTNEELDEDNKYIVYQDNHYYVLESFEQINLKDKKTKR